MGLLRLAAVLAVAVVVTPPLLPQTLLFPFHEAVNGDEIWSEQPESRAGLDRVTARAKALVRQSPIAAPNEQRHVFLTNGGWRWYWLALGNWRSFALTRTFSDAIVVNRSDPALDRVWSGATVGGVRTLSGVLAHETCHGMLRRHFGRSVDVASPGWLTEGYCDHVARESSLNAGDVARLQSMGVRSPALTYFEGRKRVALELSMNGGDVDSLFAGKSVVDEWWRGGSF